MYFLRNGVILLKKEKTQKTYLESKNNFSMGMNDKIRDLRISDIEKIPGIDLHITNGKIKAKVASKDEIISGEYQISKTGRETIKATKISCKNKKKEHLADILEMSAAGEKQEDIAFQLEMSQSYVSRLLKSYKKK